MSVCNPVEGIQCRIKSLGLFKGTVPLLQHFKLNEDHPLQIKLHHEHFK